MHTRITWILLHLLLSCSRSCWQADTRLYKAKHAQLDTNFPFLMKSEGSLPWRCPHNGGCIFLQNISKFLPDHMVSHQNASNLHSHCHNLKSFLLPSSQQSIVYCKSLWKTVPYLLTLWEPRHKMACPSQMIWQIVGSQDKIKYYHSFSI